MSNVAIPKLLQLLADRPAGDLDVVGLSLALRPTQAEIVSAIASLVGDGRLDAETLRPKLADRGMDIEAATGTDLWRALMASATTSATTSGAWIENVGVIDVAAVEAAAPPPVLSPEGNRGFKLGQGEPSRPLFDALVAEGKRRGLSKKDVSVAVWGNKARIYQLDINPTVRKATAEKVRAWIADKPAEAPAKREPAATLPRSPAPEPAIIPDCAPVQSTRAATVIPAGRKSRPYCQQPASCVAPARGSCRVCQPGSFAAQRRGHAPGAVSNKPAAVPPPERRVPLGDRRFRENRRDPTAKPDTPLMDAAERQRVNGQRHQANIRRGQEHEAAERLDAGKPPRNSFERSTMANIERRRDTEARAADPVEQAKVALQRKGRSVYAADVAGGKAGHFHVSGKRDSVGRLLDLTPAALIAEAERVTGQTFRRVT